ncbi:cytochrome P450 [Lactarius indigo]|nr:cytochrome P450 [Lactarius indigo]
MSPNFVTKTKLEIMNLNGCADMVPHGVELGHLEAHSKVNLLSVVDPKALQYILHSSGYHFPKGKEATQSVKLIAGQGVVGAHGMVHQRQRKVMNPAFFAPQLRTFLPIFQDMASKLAQKWKDEVISPDPTGHPLINVTPWLSHTTLDIIGEDAAGKTLREFVVDNHVTVLTTTLYPSRLDVVFRALWHYIPQPILHFVRYLPSREYRRFRSYSDYMRGFAQDLIKESIVKDPESKMSEDEVIDQISTLLLAGHDTTSNTMTWFLWELSKHPESQDRIRAEIEAVRAQKGKECPSPADLDSMVYTQAALKVISCHATDAEQQGRDDVIPLAFPITTQSGEQVSSIPIGKGTHIDILIGAYNRLPEIWGQDADEWNPDRFLNTDSDKMKQDDCGMNFCEHNQYATSSWVLILTHRAAGGLRGCIGWRFAVLEMLVITMTLLENFAFSLPPQSEKTRIYRKPGGVMIPMVEGEQGGWMGLIVKALK